MMNIIVKWKMTEAYYKQLWTDFILISRWRKWALHINTVLVVIGIILRNYFTQSNLKFMALILIITAIFNIAWHFWDKKRWFALLKNSNTINTEVKMEFEDEAIQHSGAFATGTMKWEIFTEIVVAPNGLLLRQQKGFSIYVPNYAFNTLSDKKDIVDKINAVLSNR